MINLRVTEEHETPQAQLGERQCQFNPSTGLFNTYEYVKAPAAIAKFDLLMRVANDDGECDVTTAASKTLADSSKSGSWTTDLWKDYFVSIIDGATPVGETLKVISNTTTILSLTPIRLGYDDQFSADLAATHRYSIHHPYFVAKTSGVAVHPAGVAPVAVTAGYFFWMQVGGRAFVTFDGTTNPSALGDVVVPSAVAGVAMGSTVGAQTILESGLGAGVRPANVVAVAGLCLVDLAL